MRKAGDVYIDNEPFAVTSYQRSTTDDMVARFGSAEQGQTNLDLFKAKTQKSWKGGMFQKTWKDDEMAGYITGFHHNALDDKLYLTPNMAKVIKTNGGMDPNGVTAWCYYNGKLYLAFRLNSPSASSNGLVYIDLSTNTVTGVTLPAALANSGVAITSMITHGNRIFMAGKSQASGIAFNVQRYDGATAFADITAPATNGQTYCRLVSFNDNLYGQGMSDLYIITAPFNNTATNVHQKIKTVGTGDPSIDNLQHAIEYNGAIYIGKTDGLYRYNGIDVVSVINNRNNINTTNYKYMAVFNGRLYFTMANRLYEFDGMNITQIVDMSDAYQIIDLAGGDDRLWISVRYNKTSPAIYESDNFEDPIATSLYTYGLFSYNGIGFFEYKHEMYVGDEGNKFGDYNSPVQYRAIPVGGFIMWFAPYLYLNASLETRSSGWYFWKQSLSVEFDLDQIGTSRSCQIMSSIADAGYPAVAKTLNAIMANSENIIDSANILMTIEVRTNYDGVISDWAEVWRSDNVAPEGTDPDYFLHDQVYGVGASDLDTEPLPFNKIEYRVLLTVTGALEGIPKLENLTMRYTLQPRVRKRWILAIPLFGADPSDIDTQFLGDGSEEQRSANQLRKVIYDAYESKLPVLFYDLDFTEMNYNDVSDKWDLEGQYFVKTGDFIAFKQQNGTWYNARVQAAPDAGTDTTEVDIDTSAVGRRLGIGGSAVDVWVNGAEVRRSYAVYVRHVQNERVHISEQNVNDENGYSDFSSELVVELVEV